MRATRILTCGLGLMMLQTFPTQASDAGAGQSAAGAQASTQTAERMDITTVSGITYSNCTITKIEPDGINVVYSSGVVKIPFEDLSKAFQKRYHYDQAKAAAYSRSIKQQQQASEAAATERRAADANAGRPASAEPQTLQGVIQAPKGGETVATPAQGGVVAAEAIQGMVKQMDESQEHFEARKRAVQDAATRQDDQNPQNGLSQAPKGGGALTTPAQGVVAAEAIQGMVKQMDESPEQFEARKRAVLDETKQKNGTP